MSGTPPRRRGGRSHRDLVRGVRRNTPASAGRTTNSTGSTTPPAEHPRVGGEDDHSSVGVSSEYGTPPRRRGGLQHQIRALDTGRNTPASAGRTTSTSARSRTGTEHPRIGGRTAPSPSGARADSQPLVGEEDDLVVHGFEAVDGTPPRRRGGPPFDRRRHTTMRTTPASAGRTTACAGPQVMTQEHPRVGGEDHGDQD